MSHCRRQVPRSSSTFSLRGFWPVKLAEHEMLHFAQSRARQIINENDIARYLEARKLRMHMRLQALGIGEISGTPDHIGDGDFVPSTIGPPDDAAFDDVGVLEQHALDFRGID